ncbi:hypothetical protein [Aliterella atlantica]|uniref:Uncharacterized protein n=1 Tax=Aliterella atlantica CENA595 TaxID=1618023 RepID=A0A0D8ZTK1_9CYAN|nr:hypothetical protein [Aliterella atlantica]KJH70571.1 hypothetical protein UH38_17550 [Aliterella atlantica CENA595]
MKLNNFTKQLSTLGRWVATTVFCFSAIAFVWQGGFFVDNSAMASPTLVASRDAGDKVKDAADDVAKGSKNFIRDTKDKVEDAASSNARKVDKSTGDDAVAERKAKSDRDTIYDRAEEDASRTEKAVDKSMNAVKRTVDNIKDAFN